MVYLTKKIHFSASHALKNPQISEAENRRIFGKKSAPHGHNYILEVTIQGEPDRQTGFLMDFEHLTQTIQEKVLSEVNWKHLNENRTLLNDLPPTAENLTKIFWKKLEKALPKGHLYEVRLAQGEGDSVSYRGG